MNPAPILLTLLRLNLWAGDATEPPENRTARLQDIAVAIAGASANRTEAAALLALGEVETRFARYVSEDRCHEGPRGMRCDEGRSRSVWQLQRAACPSLWELPPGDQRATYVAAQCAVRLLRYGRAKCGSVAGAFAVYAGRPCKDRIGPPRERRMRQVLVMLDHGGLPWPSEPRPP